MEPRTDSGTGASNLHALKVLVGVFIVRRKHPCEIECLNSGKVMYMSDAISHRRLISTSLPISTTSIFFLHGSRLNCSTISSLLSDGTGL
jgi:hypothetical protein